MAASEALSATSRIDPESWAVPVATEVTLSLTARAALDTLRAWLAVSSAEAASCWATAESSWEAPSTTLDRPAISLRADRMSPIAEVSARTIRPTSSLAGLPNVAVRSRCASRSRPVTQRLIGRVMERLIRPVSSNIATTAAESEPRSTPRSTSAAVAACFCVLVVAASRAVRRVSILLPRSW